MQDSEKGPSPCKVPSPAVRRRALLRRLTAAFEQVRSDYFPDWDRQHRWRLGLTRKSVEAWCDGKHRRITIGEARGYPHDVLESVLIHEICHSTGNRAHRGVWQRQMQTIADRAETMGRTAIAAYVREDVNRYIMKEHYSIRQMIEEDVKNDNGGIPFDVIMKKIADGQGMNLTEVFRLRSKARCRWVYDKEMRSIQHREECERKHDTQQAALESAAE